MSIGVNWPRRLQLSELTTPEAEATFIQHRSEVSGINGRAANEVLSIVPPEINIAYRKSWTAAAIVNRISATCVSRSPDKFFILEGRVGCNECEMFCNRCRLSI